MMSLPKSIKEILINQSIKNKLLFSYFLLILLPLLFLTMVSYFKVSNFVEDNMLNSAKKALEQSNSYLEYKIGNIVQAMNVITGDTNVHDILYKNDPEYNNDVFAQIKSRDKLIAFIDGQQKSFEIFRIRLYVRDGLMFSDENYNFFNLSKVHDLPWYKKLISSKDLVMWFGPNYFLNNDNDYHTPIISAARLIRSDTSFSTVISILRTDIPESVVKDIVSKSNLSSTGTSYIINNAGEIITSSGDKLLLNDSFLRKTAEDSSQPENTWIPCNSDGKKYLTIHIGVKNTNWEHITIIPYNEIRTPGTSIRNYMFVLMLITGIISYVLAYYISKSSTKRIMLLAQNMGKVRNGDFSTNMDEGGNDEISQLTRSFNFMVKEMSELIYEKVKAGQKIKALELKSLQAQINPHFLYNSLDMINWSATINGITDIETMVQSLSKFYKLGLSKGREVIAIRDEIEHIKAYVTIQNLRYENCIGLELDVDENIQYYSTLKIILQPIVENSILHGILKKKQRAGNICITGKLCDEKIIISVQDDGEGMSEETRQNILNSDSHDEIHGYGIKNINDRIKLHYGSEYGLEYFSEPGKGTTVVVTIPAIKYEKDI
jgi:two-component system, sensor histidine kinase YesM